MKTVICNSCGNRVSEQHANVHGICAPCMAKEIMSSQAGEALHPTVKTCKKCGLPKPRSAFSAHKRTRDGLQTYCKECSNNYLKAHYADRKEKLKELEAIKQSGGKVTPVLPLSLRDYQIKNQPIDWRIAQPAAKSYATQGSPQSKQKPNPPNPPKPPKNRPIRTKMTKKERRFLTHCAYLAVISCLSVYILFQL